MKKILFAIAAVALAVVSCDKNAPDTTVKDYSNVKVSLSVTMPDALTKANYSLSNPSNPIGGLTFTWAEDDKLTLIVFQGDNANWKNNCVYTEFNLPAAAEGTTHYDVSGLTTSLDLSGFDSNENLKYVILFGGYFNDYWKIYSFHNGVPYIPYNSSISDQISAHDMIAETAVKEVPFPSGDLELSGSLHWITSVLALQFDIDPAADVVYPNDYSLIFQLNRSSNFINMYEPVTRYADTVDGYMVMPINFTGDHKLSDALDANNCRYFVIQSDGMTSDYPSAKIAGSTFSVRNSNNTDYTASGSVGGSVVIEAGKVYGMKIKVTDSDSDGVPEFAKL